MSRTVAIFAGLAAASIWGGMYVVSKVVLEVVPPFLLLTLRLILGAVTLAIILLLLKRGWPSRRRVGAVLLVGVVGYGISLGLQFVGTKLSTAANASLVTSASPAFIMLFGVLLLGEPITQRRLIALALATIGVLAVIDPGSAQLRSEAFYGNLALFGAAVTWGLYSVLVRLASFHLGTLQISLISFTGGLLIGIPASGIELQLSDVGPITMGVVLGILYLGLVSTALAMYLWNKSLALLEAGTVSLLFFAQPVVGAGLGAVLLGEELSFGFWLGGILILAGLIVGSRGGAEEKNGRQGALEPWET